MLTRCIEKGREKCDHYWPMDTLPAYYGDISVTILNEAHYTDWSITEFMLCRVNICFYKRIFIYLFIIYLLAFRTTLIAWSNTSTSRRGLTLGCRVHRRHSRGSSGRSGREFDPISDQLSSIVARASVAAARSSPSTGYCSRFSCPTTWTSSALSMQCERSACGWCRRSNSTYAYISACWLCSRARTPLGLPGRYTTTRALKVNFQVLKNKNNNNNNCHHSMNKREKFWTISKERVLFFMMLGKNPSSLESSQCPSVTENEKERWPSSPNNDIEGKFANVQNFWLNFNKYIARWNDLLFFVCLAYNFIIIISFSCLLHGSMSKKRNKYYRQSWMEMNNKLYIFLYYFSATL